MYITVDETLENIQFWKYKPYFDKQLQDWESDNSKAYLGCLSSDSFDPSARYLIGKLIKKSLFRKKVVKF